ncbi:DUF4406 domain-containing protein [Rhodoferax sp. GW822-FHT02A01]|jgi:hypothetical protein|uniref:DUF4406 domain-containing protein n=1 Tax=Rhodoferax sp. GW822-FHT02A01 TaxID=3141537 RepID=UPI00315D6FE7
MLILISGPYLTGTDGDPAKVAKNLAAMEQMALPIFERGHLALVGEWLAWPVIRAAGGLSHNDAVFKTYQYPVAHRLLGRCDAVYRIPGASNGADIEVAKAREMGLPVYTSLDEVPYVSEGD